ncbi:MAG: hypothetical protein FJ303_22280 [Planctomycetes bacterium]|nr:hypothetical protein [Planctomycetota bacterium]
MRPVIRQLDVRPPSALTTAVLTLRAADAQAVVGALRQALPSVQVYADVALGAVVLQGEAEQVERARAMVAALDQPVAAGGAGVRTEVIVLKHVPPSEFAQERATGRLAEDIANRPTTPCRTPTPTYVWRSTGASKPSSSPAAIAPSMPPES